MSKGYKIHLVFVFGAFGILGLIAWKLGILNLLIDTYYVPPSEWNTIKLHQNNCRLAFLLYLTSNYINKS